MTAQRFFLWAAAILGGAFAGGAAVYFPPEFWTPPRLFAAGMVPLSLGLFAWTARARSTDAGLAAMGISGALCVVHLAAALWVFSFARTGADGLTLVLCIGNLAFAALIVLVARAAIPIITDEIARNDIGSEYARIARDLAASSTVVEDGELRSALLALAEELRYYPRHIALDGPLPDGVDERAAELARHIGARAWPQARDALPALRLALELSRRGIQSRYTKA